MAPSKFTGKIHWVQIDLGKDDQDDQDDQDGFMDPDERLRIALGRQ